MRESNEKSSSKVFFWKTFLFSFLPSLLLVVYLIYTLVEVSMMNAGWIAALITGIALVISTTISAIFSFKASRLNNKDKNGEKLTDKIAKIGNPKESLSAEHDLIKKDLNDITSIANKLDRFNNKELNKFITIQNERSSRVGDSGKALDIIQNSINSLNFQVEKLTNRNLELEKKIEIMQHHLNEKDDLIKKLSNNFDKNKDFER